MAGPGAGLGPGPADSHDTPDVQQMMPAADDIAAPGWHPNVAEPVTGHPGTTENVKVVPTYQES